MQGSEVFPFGTHFNEKWLKDLTGGHPVIRCTSEGACKPGDNFVSKVTRYFLYYQSDTGNEEVITLIEKMQNPPNSSPLDCLAMFHNEITAYQVILPKLSTKNLTPVCHLACLNCPILVLQDLQPDGFRMADKKAGLGFAECSLVLQALAYLHSRSFYLKSTSNEWASNCTKLHETVFGSKSEELNEIWENSFWMGLESLRTSQNPVLVRTAKSLNTLSGRVMATLSQLSKSHDEFQVICHGDLWSNNILFRYGEDKKAMDVRLIDLQAMRPSSCALDILHLLCTSASPKLLTQHFQTWISLYYSRLKQELSTKQISMPFTEAELHIELKKKHIFGLILGFMMIPCSTSEPSIQITLDNNQLDKRQEEFSKLGENCHNRMRQLVFDLVGLGLL